MLTILEAQEWAKTHKTEHEKELEEITKMPWKDLYKILNEPE